MSSSSPSSWALTRQSLLGVAAIAALVVLIALGRLDTANGIAYIVALGGGFGFGTQHERNVVEGNTGAGSLTPGGNGSSSNGGGA